MLVTFFPRSFSKCLLAPTVSEGLCGREGSSCGDSLPEIGLAGRTAEAAARLRAVRALVGTQAGGTRDSVGAGNRKCSVKSVAAAQVTTPDAYPEAPVSIHLVTHLTLTAL